MFSFYTRPGTVYRLSETKTDQLFCDKKTSTQNITNYTLLYIIHMYITDKHHLMFTSVS